MFLQTERRASSRQTSVTMSPSLAKIHLCLNLNFRALALIASWKRGVPLPE
ncbi:MAG: hypothetical protein K1X72_17675 [Pyrinomonadaceae bacterium]|nr:hypothetical protein [Pyrinomonadaceae bacterium]